MSGGYFKYDQHRIEFIAEEVEHLIAMNGKHDQNYTDKTLAKFAEAIRTLRMGAIMVNRIDWLVSGDDDEDDFHTRLEDDIFKEENAGWGCPDCGGDYFQNEIILPNGELGCKCKKRSNNDKL